MSLYAATIQNLSSGVNVTAHVRSYSYFSGRQSYLDNWNGNQLSIVINNDNNQAALFGINNKISVSSCPGYFWVAEIQYNDAYGTTNTVTSGKGSTARIICDDWLARAGRLQATNLALTQARTITQIGQFSSLLTANGIPVNTSLYGTGESTASATTYTGTVANRINLNMTTEKGLIRISQDTAYFLARNNISINSSVFISGRNEGGSTIFYQDFQRITLGQNFLNNMTVTPDGLASQEATNTFSKDLYNIRSGTLSTVDATTTQALGLAQWIAYSQGEPMTLRFETTITDTGNTSAKFSEWLSYITTPNFWGLSLHYSVPGAGSTTELDVVLEGVQISGTPDQTVTTAYWSPRAFYEVFILNSSTQGRLDQNRLGW